jgi:hypothetical protein
MSGGMSQPDTYYWIFTTTDAIDEVAAFYQGSTGLTPRISTTAGKRRS